MTKRKQILVLLAGVLLLAGVAGTFAWLSVTGVLVNEFGFGSVTPSVDETLDNNVKSDVAVKNSGSAPAYLRVAVDIYWQDKDGARLWDEPVEGTDYAIVWGDVSNASTTGSASSWVRSADGFYTGRLPLRRSARRACSSRACPRRRRMVRTWSSTFRPKLFSLRPTMQLKRHGAVRSRMACWCRRMEVRKYGVLDSQRCCALLALRGRGYSLHGHARRSCPCVCRYSRDCL